MFHPEIIMGLSGYIKLRIHNKFHVNFLILNMGFFYVKLSL